MDDDFAGMNHPWPLFTLFEETVHAMRQIAMITICHKAGRDISMRTAILFKKLFPDRALRARLLDSTIATDGTTASTKSVVQAWMAVIERVIQIRVELRDEDRLDLMRFSGSIPWTIVLERARPYIWKQLRTATETEQVPFSQQVAIMDHSIRVATKSRRLFVTAGNLVGLGPLTMEMGDKLCLLKGGKTPFILREKGSRHVTRAILDDDTTIGCYVHPLSASDEFKVRGHFRDGASILEGEVRTYELIGDCYAHGLMDFKTPEKGLEDIRQKSSLGSELRWHTGALV